MLTQIPLPKNTNGNRIERALSYEYLSVYVDEKLTW